MKPTKEQTRWYVLIAAALFARLIGLGHRAMSHDESLHVFYSFNLFRGFASSLGRHGVPAFEHDPMMHGPLLFHLNALVYAVFGANDFTARIVPALAGTACVAMLWLYRRWLGRRGAFLAAALVAFNPGLLAYSRYIRNDIYISLFTLVMFWGALRYRETLRPAFLIALVGGYALSFVTKEVSFIHGVVLGAVCTLLLAWESAWEAKRIPDALHSSELPAARWGDVAAVLFTLALPFATPLFFKPLGWAPWDREVLPRSPEELMQTATVGLTLAGLSCLVALAWFRRSRRLGTWALCFVLFWVVQILFFTTLFTNTARGLDSGIAGSLGYWLPQHEVERGSPDPFFYVSLILLYEPLLALTAIPGAWRARRPAGAALLLWALGNLLIYSWAVERMPWLMIHVSLPLCLLAGPSLAAAFQAPRRSPARALTAGAAALLCLHMLVNSIRANGPLAESHREPLYFAHGGEDLKIAVRIVERQLARHPNGLVQVHPEFAWPLVWYFRETPTDYSEFVDPPRRDAVAAIVPPNMRNAYVGTPWVARGEFQLIHWPRQEWHTLSRQNLHRLATNTSTRRTFFRFYFLRDVPDPGPHDFPHPVHFLLITREGE